jgi:hypothetical protein
MLCNSDIYIKYDKLLSDHLLSETSKMSAPTS